MAMTQYKKKKFQQKSLDKIEKANEIIAEYQAQGFSLTLRQIYYQFVARGWSENSQKAYKALGNVIAEARMAGLIDWAAMEDRTRSLRGLGSYSDPESAIWRAMASYRRDKWEVWIEKDALLGVVSPVCNELDVDYFALRGYASHTSLHDAAQRIIGYNEEGQEAVILHMGDYDPEGWDITRDIENKMRTFGADVEVRRIALNREQVDRYNPPPAPVKLSSSRADQYVIDHGHEVWELDALEPTVMADLIRDNVQADTDVALLEALNLRTENEKAELRQLYNQYDDVIDWLNQ
jgi:hypothetical protein